MSSASLALLDLNDMTNRDTVPSLSDLYELFDRVDGDVYSANPGDTYLLFSGEQIDGGSGVDFINQLYDAAPMDGVHDIGSSEIGKFTSNQAFSDALENAILKDHFNTTYDLATPEQISEMKNVHSSLMTGFDLSGNRVETASFWDLASDKFVSDANGNFKILAPNIISNDSVLIMSELPALLSNQNVETIDGIPREELKHLWDAGDIDSVKQLITSNSFMQLASSGLGSEVNSTTITAYLEATLDHFNTDGLTAQQITHIQEALDTMSEDTKSYLTQSKELALDLSKTAGSGLLKALGPLGIGLGYMLAVNEASAAEAAGNHDEARHIMNQWAAESAGSELGSIAGGAIAGIALTALAALGVTISAPIAIVVVIGGAMAGGYFGGEVAGDFYASLVQLSPEQQQDIINRLDALLFGEYTNLTPELIESTNNGQLAFEGVEFITENYHQIVDNAKSNIAWRYALRELNPFVVGEADYDKHNTDGSLDLYDPETDTGFMTDEWLRTRAIFLTYQRLYWESSDTDGEYNTQLIGDYQFIDEVNDTRYELEVDGLDFGLLPTQIIHFGGDQSDTLTGQVADDYLFGASGDDTLNGGRGDDHLEGGTGHDTYTFADGDGNDVIMDTDGDGRIVVNGHTLTGGAGLYNGTRVWTSDDGQVTYSRVDNDAGGNDLLIRFYGSDDTVLVKDFNFSTAVSPATADLGLSLRTDDHAPLVTSSLDDTPAGRYDTVYGSNGNEAIATGGGDDLVLSYNGDDVVDLGDGSDVINAGVGNDIVEGGAGNDYIVGGASTQIGEYIDDDLLIGGEGNDLINGGFGDDTIRAGNRVDGNSGGQPWESGWELQQGDWLLGGEGNDNILGSRSRDMLNGGAGEDIIDAGDGDDVILGDAHYDFWSLFAPAVVFDSPNENLAADHQFIEGQTLPDRTPSSSVVRRPDSAFLFQTDTSGIDFDFTTPLARNPDQWQRLMEGGGNDVIHGGQGNDWVAGQTGNDIINGGDGNDTLHGDDVALMNPEDQGDDWLVGEAGDDKLFGGGGDDHLYGGDDNDQLVGDGVNDSGNDVLDGGAGDDTLDAGRGDDTLRGGDGHDELDAGAGNDFLSGGEGRDTLDGGDGNDDLYGGAANDTLNGGQGQDHLSGGSGNDILVGGDGNDTLVGGEGLDHLNGGAGYDRYLFSVGDDAGVTSTVTDSSANNLIVLSGMTLSELQLSGSGTTWTLQYSANDTVQLNGQFHIRVVGETYTLTDLQNALNNLDIEAVAIPTTPDITGTNAADTLLGTAADELLAGFAGNDVLSGGEGNDIYQFNSGDGHDQIDNAASDNAGAIDGLIFGEAITPESIGVTQSGNDLVLTLSGSDSVTLRDYYADNANNKIDFVRFADGTVLNQAALENLALHITPATEGNDNLLGTVDDDVIEGLAGDDDIDGGQGGDRLSGGDGSDTYFFHLGDGQDVIDNTASDNATALDGVALGAGITADDVTLLQEGDDLLIQLSSGDSIQVLSYFATSRDNRIDQIVFADGTVWDQAAITTHLSDGNQSTDGDDTIIGSNADDVLYGLAGNDHLVGSDGNDHLDGGTGADTLEGGAGNDIYQVDNIGDVIIESAFAGADTVNSAITYTLGDQLEDLVLTGEHLLDGTGNNSDNRIQGNSAANQLFGLSGDDTLHGNEGDDRLEGGQGNDALYGGSGDDALIGGVGQDNLQGGAGNDIYYFRYGDDWGVTSNVNDTEGDNVVVLEGVSFEDMTLTGQDNAWTLQYSAHDQVYLYGNIASVVINGDSYTLNDLQTLLEETNPQGPPDNLSISLTGTDLDDVIMGSAESERIDGGEGNDTIRAGDAYDSVFGGEGSDTLYGEGGDDAIYGQSDADQLYGGAGNDQLSGGEGEDILDGGTGNDLLQGGHGLDTYIFGPGSGQDRLFEHYYSADQSGGVVRLTGVTPAQVGVSMNGWNQGHGDYGGIYITIDGTDDSLWIARFFIEEAEDAYPVDQFVFDDGTVWTPDDIRQRMTMGSEDADILYGFSDDQSIEGLGGNDEIHGMDGNDILRGGDGNDRLGHIGFLPGSVTNAQGEDIIAGMINERGDDLLDGGAGNDYLYGGNGNDTLLGGDGDDWLQDRFGSDFFDGGAGNDYLLANAINGNDRKTFYFDRGYDSDVIFSSRSQPGTKNDVVQFGASVLLSDLDFQRIDTTGDNNPLIGSNPLSDYISSPDADLVGDDLIITIRDTGDQLTIRRYFEKDAEGRIGYGDVGVAELQLADGTTLTVDDIKNRLLQTSSQDDVVYGYEGDDVIDGLAGHDEIWGYDGNDTLYGGAGEDTLQGNSGDDLLYGGEGNDQLNGSVGNDQLHGGTGTDLLFGNEGNDTLYGGAGDDDLRADTGDDVLDGGQGNDQLHGWRGHDTYVFGHGYGEDTVFETDRNNTLRFLAGVSPDQLRFSRPDAGLNFEQNNLVIAIAGSTDRITIHQFFADEVAGNYPIGEFQFDDGTTWTVDDIKAALHTGSDGDDVIYGYSSDDHLQGLAGHDQLGGGEGDDRLEGGDGNDTLGSQGTFREDGDDTLLGGAGNDTLFADNGNDYLSGGSGEDDLRGGNGDDVLEGDAGNDRLFGNQGDDYLDGGSGDDFLFGEGGSDTYYFGIGSGSDTINDTVALEGDVDNVVFGSGLTPADIRATRLAGGGGYSTEDLYLTIIGGSDQLQVVGFFQQEGNSDYSIEQFIFDDGTVWTAADIRELTQVASSLDDVLYGYSTDDSIDGLSGNDSVYGAGGNDTLAGGAGNDTLGSRTFEAGDDILSGGAGDDFLYGGEGNDQLSGDDGNDWLEGNQGNDLLDGGAGDDFLDGGAGSDRYIWGMGYGNDVISSIRLNTADHNIIELRETASTDVSVSRGGINDDLILTIHSTGETLTVSSYFVMPERRVDAIEFGDGTVWNEAAVMAFASNTAPDAVSDSANAQQDSPIVLTFNELLANDSDVDGDVLTIVSVANGVNGAVAIDMVSETITFTPDAGYYGPASFDYVISDGLQGFSTASVSLNIIPGNDEPVLVNHMLDQQIISGVGFTYIIPADSFNDADGDSLTLTASMDDGSPLPAWISFDAATGIFTVLPSEADVGSLAITVTATDPHGASVSDTFSVNVTSADALPDITLIGTVNNDSLSGTAEDELIIGDAGDDYLYGQGGDDVLRGDEGNDWLYGHNGNDILEGGNGDDSVNGGLGNDLLDGGEGNDTYHWSQGDGNDSITDLDSHSNNVDQLVFGGGLTLSDFSLSQNNDDLIFTLNNTNETITINNHFSNDNHRLETVVFSNGDITNISHIEFLAQYSSDKNVIWGTVGNDESVGTNSADLMVGQGGNDVLLAQAGDDVLYGGNTWNFLSGGQGNDTYLYTGGELHIDNYDGNGYFAHDELHLLDGINPENVSAFRSGSNLLLTIDNGSGQEPGLINISHYFGTGAYQGTISDEHLDEIHFEDGTVWTAVNLREMLTVMEGNEGDDVLQGLDGGQQLYGYGGNDRLYGYDGDDLLVGGTGNDLLFGRLGNDLYRFDVGFGQDRIFNSSGYDEDSSGDDTARFENIDYNDLWFTRRGDDLQINVASTDDQLTIDDWFDNSDDQLDRIETDTHYLLSHQVDLLVNAMSTFDVPSGVGTPNPIDDPTNNVLQNTLVNTWQAAS